MGNTIWQMILAMLCPSRKVNEDEDGADYVDDNKACVIRNWMTGCHACFELISIIMTSCKCHNVTL